MLRARSDRTQGSHRLRTPVVSNGRHLSSLLRKRVTHLVSRVGNAGSLLTGSFYHPRPAEIIYFKLYKSQIPVIEQAIETAALMLGSDKSRGYCLEMICADFLAGAHLEISGRTYTE